MASSLTKTLLRRLYERQPLIEGERMGGVAQEMAKAIREILFSNSDPQAAIWQIETLIDGILMDAERMAPSGAKTMNFNELTDAQTERLALLAEECGEVIYVVGKILRHGYESRNPLDSDSLRNVVMLEKELGDVTNAMAMLTDAGDISRDAVLVAARRKSETIGRWLHHQHEPLGNATDASDK